MLQWRNVGSKPTLACSRRLFEWEVGMSVSYDDLETQLLAKCIELIQAVQEDRSTSKQIAGETMAFIEERFGTDQILAARRSS